MRERRVYLGLNLLAIGAAACLFPRLLPGLWASEAAGGERLFLWLLLSVLLVQGLKGLRFYLLLYEKRLPRGLFVRQYAKTVPVSMLLPLKLGDLFRAYCFGYHLERDYLAGLAVVVLDRFADTLALVTVLVFFVSAFAYPLDVLFFLLVTFLVLLFALYLAGPGLVSYWRDYFLRQRAGRRTLFYLALLARGEKVYRELAQVVRGKFLIAYLLSLFAWGAELCGLYLAASWCGTASGAMLAYLRGALWGAPTAYLASFIGVSVCVLVACYGLSVFVYSLKGRKENDRSAGCAR